MTDLERVIIFLTVALKATGKKGRSGHRWWARSGHCGSNAISTTGKFNVSQQRKTIVLDQNRLFKEVCNVVDPEYNMWNMTLHSSKPKYDKVQNRRQHHVLISASRKWMLKADLIRPEQSCCITWGLVNHRSFGFLPVLVILWLSDTLQTEANPYNDTKQCSDEIKTTGSRLDNYTCNISLGFQVIEGRENAWEVLICIVSWQNFRRMKQIWSLVSTLKEFWDVQPGFWNSYDWIYSEDCSSRFPNEETLEYFSF